ncbi:MAG: flagellar basal body rod protein FlgB [Planctomycetes bacterium]|nr:flagellar basal body rod protein FlgB [Planctomycetota bacterium]
MSKINSIIDFLEAGLKAENMRQTAISSNIANLETPGYRRVDVKFDELLKKALNSPGDVDINEIKPEIHNPKLTPLNSNGNDVNLEAEVGEMVKNSLRYKTYIRLINKKYSQMDLAINVK